MARSYTITQSGESRSYTIDDGVGAPGSDAEVTLANVRAAVPNMVEVASPVNDDMIQRVGGSWVTRTLAQVKTALGLGSAAYTASTAYATAAQGTTADGALQRSGGTMTGNITLGTNTITSTSGGFSASLGNGAVGATFGSNTAYLTSSAVTWSNGTHVQTLSRPTLTDNRTATLPDADGTIALTSDSRFTDERVPTAAGLTSKFGTEKTTPVSADRFATFDSAASNVPKYITWTNAWVNYFKGLADALYVGLTGDQTIAGTKTFSGNTVISGDLTVDTSTLKVDSTNNRVGIGTASPSVDLHVYKNDTIVQTYFENISSTGRTLFQAKSNVCFVDMRAHGTAYSGGNLLGQAEQGNLTLMAQGGKFSIGTGDAQTLHLATNDATRMTIDTSGNVGIANTSPAEKLDVTGNILASGTIKTGGYTVATLPTGVTGKRAYVTDATATTFYSTVAGGGSNVVPVFYNGTNWVIA